MMNKKWWWILLIFVAVGLLIAAILRVLTPPEVPVPLTSFSTTNYDQTQTVFSRVTFSGEKKAFPTSLPIHTATSNQTTTDVVAFLAQQYNLVNQNKVNETWRNQNGDNLRISKYTGQIQFTLGQEIASGSALPVDELQQQALALLKQTLPIKNPDQLVVDQNQVVFIENEDELYEQVPYQEASAMLVPTDYVLSGFPVRFEKITDPTFMTTISKSGQLIKIVFYPQFYSFQAVGDKDIISLDQALVNINNNQASVIGLTYTDGEKIQALNLANIANLNLTTVDLEYRIDTQTTAVYPFYRFSGVGTDANKNQLNIEIITPAVATTSQ